MNQTPIPADEWTGRLDEIKSRAADWLDRRQVAGQPFGHFQLCAHAEVADELNAATGALELWVLLGLPLTDEQREQAVAHLQSFQNPATGLVIDSSWSIRQIKSNPRQSIDGDTFFSMTAVSALEALGATFLHPVRFLAQLSPEQLLKQTDLLAGAHTPAAIGDYAALIRTNQALNVPGADAQWEAVCRNLQERQDPVTGLWPAGEPGPLTPWVNRAFHLLRSTWNHAGEWFRGAEAMAAACLRAADDPSYYSWQTGYACNDLDLAHVLYSARCFTGLPRDEVARWAQARLPLILSVQKPDGGFSFFHDAAMVDHGGLRMSPGLAEGDTWGTLMYLGTIKMMVELGYPGLTVPWAFSQVHKVPERGLSWE